MVLLVVQCSYSVIQTMHQLHPEQSHDEARDMDLFLKFVLHSIVLFVHITHCFRCCY
jgi:hypothetical protein